jgi:hypothetical protein
MCYIMSQLFCLRNKEIINCFIIILLKKFSKYLIKNLFSKLKVLKKDEKVSSFETFKPFSL